MSKAYESIVDWSAEDQPFVVGVPELPGGIADGETHDRAVTNARQLGQEWIDGLESSVGRSRGHVGGCRLRNLTTLPALAPHTADAERGAA